MTDIGYTPAFDPTDWIDNVDRITADGPNGFNVRFDAIGSDLHQAAAVVTRIDAALAQSVGLPTGLQVLTPGLDLNGGWLYDRTGAAHPDSSGSSRVAVMGLSLPADVNLVSFRAMGLYPGNPTALSIALIRAPLADVNATPDKLAEINSAVTALTNPYDITMPVDVTLAAVDLETYRYCVVATATTADLQTSNATSVATVQLTCTAN